ncbi:quinone-dependent dihydroorotate dehydrogenase [Alkalimarinus sediminis]|uniref:Dihydroorotate dehydrogenase (quinone) n=1 Tax=Alkalimarinus sediminis TaxID=1632866 RepID=A0A9E8KQP3_9ALTE|nr:quinone-dependent dihydroorotate dehydrogenase [Alkalimarinus sediminis]UZW76658.1 quinone-dependent dihydroorotate dehydrogenase [Alkalimarinus sediminis]
MAYKLLRNLLFQLSPEVAHEASLDLISASERLGLLKPFVKLPSADPVEVMGVNFENPVGLAAGLDKNGDHIDGLAALGFGSIEIGTVTPRPQAGNPKPRLFRIAEREAIINRMGFNNLGVDYLVENVKNARFSGVLGINVGKNFDTPVEQASDDYLIGIRKVYPYATYITVNVSSPNTPGLRDLQFGDSLKQLLEAIKEEQQKLCIEHGKRVPIAIKIAPDMESDDVRLVSDAFKQFEVDGVIATNTTISRVGLEGCRYADEAGGLSGAPLTHASTDVVKALYAELGESIPIIGVGGIVDGASAADKIEAGAKLVQVYSGFIYHGPSLIREAAEAIASVRR